MHRKDFSKKCSINLCQKSVCIIWITREDYIGQRLKIHDSILKKIFSGIKNSSSNINSILPPDRQSNKKTKLNTKTVSQILCQLCAKQLVSIITSCTVYI